MLYRLLIAAVLVLPLTAQQRFNKVQVVGGAEGVKDGAHGELVVGRDEIVFESKRHPDLKIPSDSVSELFYSQVAGRRMTAAVVLTPWLAFAKWQKHFVTVTWDAGEKGYGAVEFRVHKDQYRRLVRTLEQAAETQVVTDNSKRVGVQPIPGRPKVPERVGLLSITSDPPGAEVYINGSFNGLTPRRKEVKPGEYAVRVEKNRASALATVTVEAGQTASKHMKLAPQ